ncbi:MAG: hypothetical protein II306_06455 [Clostridia bacterium]|nr:hypothetical protein [Clostridia bacterium]
MQGFRQALAEYEAKITNPFESDYLFNQDEYEQYMADEVEEIMLERAENENGN